MGYPICEKMSFDTRTRAQTIAVYKGRKYNKRFRAYHCHKCYQYHLTTKKVFKSLEEITSAIFYKRKRIPRSGKQHNRLFKKKVQNRGRRLLVFWWLKSEKSKEKNYGI